MPLLRMTFRTSSAVRIPRTSMCWPSGYLPPFAKETAFPSADYYGGSVAVGLAPRRRSLTFPMRYVRASLRQSVRPFHEPLARPSPPRRLRLSTARTTATHTGRPQGGGTVMLTRTGGPTTQPGRTGLQAVKLLPCDAGLAGRGFSRLVFPSRFANMLLSPSPFGSR